MKYGLKILHNNQRDLSTSLYFQSDEKYFLFNCPDGIQRIASQAKMKFKNGKFLIFQAFILIAHFLVMNLLFHT